MIATQQFFVPGKTETTRRSGVFVFLKKTTLLCLLFFSTAPLFAQTTWTGATSTDWHVTTNWMPAAVPTAADDVIIADVANDPTISAAALAKTVTVDAGGVLTIAANSSLTINGSTTFNTSFRNSGTVQNNGTISIGSVTSPGVYGLQNLGIFNNNTGGQIQIDRSTTTGLYNVAGTFNNAATITIGANASVGQDGLQNNAIFNNNTGGQIHLDRSSFSGMYNESGTFNNAATITIGAAIVSSPSFGLDNFATFNNNTGGQIHIDRSSSAGIRNVPGTTFTNSQTIIIGANATVGTHGIINEGTFSNNTGGQIHIDNSTTNGIWNESGTFINSQTITIGTTATVGEIGIFNTGTFNNNANSVINIDNTTFQGFNNQNGTTNNSGQIIIGTTAFTGVTGLDNRPGATFNNLAGGLVKADRATDAGVTNNGFFINDGTITAGSIAGFGGGQHFQLWPLFQYRFRGFAAGQGQRLCAFQRC